MGLHPLPTSKSQLISLTEVISPTWLESNTDLLTALIHYLSNVRHTWQNCTLSKITLKGNIHIYLKCHPAVPKRESWEFSKYEGPHWSCAAAPQLSQHPAAHISGISKSGMSQAWPPCHRGSPHLAAGAAFLPHHPLPGTPALLWPCAEAVQLTEISRKLIIFQIQTWLPAQAQECQSQHKREARKMCLGKEEEEGVTSPTPVNVSVGCQGASSRYGAAGQLSKSLDKVSVHTWPQRQGSALGFLHLTLHVNTSLRTHNVLPFPAAQAAAFTFQGSFRSTVQGLQLGILCLHGVHLPSPRCTSPGSTEPGQGHPHRNPLQADPAWMNMS